jgi:hypothetical protein
MNIMRTIAAVAVSFLCWIATVSADQLARDPKQIDSAIQPQTKLIIRPEELFPLTRPTRLGMFTLQPPQTTGEVIRVSIPVGELVSKAARALSDANHRRSERKADERVRKDLEQFLATSTDKRDATAP